MPTYDVPVTLPDGREFDVPVEGVETPEEAVKFVEEQMAAGALEFPAAEPEGQGQATPTPGALGGFEGDEGRSMAELASGVEQFGYNVAILGLKTARGLVPDELAPDFIVKTHQAERAVKAAKAQEEFAISQQFAQTWGEEPNDFMIMMGQELPLLPLAFVPGLQGTTLARAAGFNALQGALAGSIATADGDPLQGAGMGALLGAGITYALGGLPGVRSYLGRKWVKQSETKYAQERLALEQKIREVTGNEDFGFSLAGIAQENPFLISLERGSVASNQQAIARQKANLQTLVDFLETKAGSIEDRGIIAKELGGLMTRVSDSMHGVARRNYQMGMNHLIDNFGDDILIDGNKYLDDLETLLVEDMGVGSGQVPPAVRKHIEKVDLQVRPAQVKQNQKGKFVVTDRKTGELLLSADNYEVAARYANGYNKANGGLTTEQSVDILKSHNRLISGEQNVFDNADIGSNNHLGKFLKSSMLGSLRGNSSGAVRLMTKINNAYSHDMQLVREIRNSHLGKLFGGDPTVMTPNEALEQLLGEGTDRASLAATREVLQAEAPDLLYDLQRQQVREVISRGRSGAFSSADLETDINLLMTALSGKGDKSNVGRVGMGLFSPGQQQHMIDAAKSLSVLRTTYLKTGQADVGAASLAADVGINIVSRSPEFVARLLVRMGSRGATIAELMTDPKAREALIQMANNGPNSPKFKLAAQFLAVWTGQVTGEQDKIAQEQQDKAAQVEDPGGA